MATAQDKESQIAKAIKGTLVSPNEMDSNFEDANVVDGLFAIARAIDRLAKAIERSPRSDKEFAEGED